MKKIVEGAVNSVKIKIGLAEDDVIRMKKDRLDKCQECPHLQKTIRRCKLCGCFVDLKAASKSSECPDKRW